MKETIEEKKVLDKLIKNYKELSEGEFNYELLTSPNADFELLLRHLENQIQLVNSHPDSKKRFEIATNFLKKLASDNLLETFHTLKAQNDFINVKKVTQGADNLKTMREMDSLIDEKAIKPLCDLYVFAYERACRLYFKPLAQAITKKKILSCGECITRIIEYYPTMEFVLEPYKNTIRNSISHTGYYYRPKEKLIVFEDHDKQPIGLTIEDLKTFCTLEVVSDLSISTADQALKLPISKISQFYFDKIEEYCKDLQIDFNEAVIGWVSQGYKLVGLYSVLKILIEIHKINNS